MKKRKFIISAAIMSSIFFVFSILLKRVNKSKKIDCENNYS